MSQPRGVFFLCLVVVLVVNSRVVFHTEPCLFDGGDRIQGKYEEAEALYERCQAILEKTLGPEHPSYAATLHSRAGLLETQVRGKRCFRALLKKCEVSCHGVWRGPRGTYGNLCLSSWWTGAWQ